MNDIKLTPAEIELIEAKRQEEIDNRYDGYVTRTKLATETRENRKSNQRRLNNKTASFSLIVDQINGLDPAMKARLRLRVAHRMANTGQRDELKAEGYAKKSCYNESRHEYRLDLMVTKFSAYGGKFSESQSGIDVDTSGSKVKVKSFHLDGRWRTVPSFVKKMQEKNAQILRKHQHDTLIKNRKANYISQLKTKYPNARVTLVSASVRVGGIYHYVEKAKVVFPSTSYVELDITGETLRITKRWEANRHNATVESTLRRLNDQPAKKS